MNIRYSEIIRKKAYAEANIQAEFYKLCRDSKIQILLEVKYEDCRFDAVVFLEDVPVAIVEVKNFSYATSMRGLNKTGRQFKKYSRYGMPVIALLNSKQIIPRFNQLLEIIERKQHEKQHI